HLEGRGSTHTQKVEEVAEETSRNASDRSRAFRRGVVVAAAALTAFALPAVALAAAGAGDPDPNVFGVDGKVGVHGTATSDDLLVTVALTPDGKILAGGLAQENGVAGVPEFVTAVRRNADGSPDASFGKNGVVLVGSAQGVQGQTTGIAPTADGGVV